MVLCPECGAQQAEAARFCQQCGASLEQETPGGHHHGGQNRGQSSGPRQQRQPQNQPQGGGGQGPRAANQGPTHGQPTGGSGHGTGSVYDDGYRDAGFGMVPPGIKFLCIGMGVLGGFLLLAGGISADMGSAASRAGASNAGSMLGNLGAVFMLIGFGSFGGIYGLWNRRTWGWFLTVALFGLGALLSLSLLGGGAQGMGVVLLVVQGAIVGYLLTKREMYEVDRYLS